MWRPFYLLPKKTPALTGKRFVAPPFVRMVM